MRTERTFLLGQTRQQTRPTKAKEITNWRLETRLSGDRAGRPVGAIFPGSSGEIYVPLGTEGIAGGGLSGAFQPKTSGIDRAGPLVGIIPGEILLQKGRKSGNDGPEQVKEKIRERIKRSRAEIKKRRRKTKKRNGSRR